MFEDFVIICLMWGEGGQLRCRTLLVQQMIVFWCVDGHGGNQIVVDFIPTFQRTSIEGLQDSKCAPVFHKNSRNESPSPSVDLRTPSNAASMKPASHHRCPGSPPGLAFRQLEARTNRAASHPHCNKLPGSVNFEASNSFLINQGWKTRIWEHIVLVQAGVIRDRSLCFSLSKCFLFVLFRSMVVVSLVCHSCIAACPDQKDAEGCQECLELSRLFLLFLNNPRNHKPS